MSYLILALAGSPFYISLAFILARKPLRAMWIVLGLYLFEVITVSTEGINLGVQIYPADLVFGLLFGAALIRLMFLTPFRRVDKIALFLLGLFLLSFLRGVPAYGLKNVGVESRSTFYFVVSVIFFSTCRISRAFLIRSCEIWLQCCVVLMALAIFRWTALVLGLGIVDQWAEMSGETPMRVLNAGGALFLAVGFLMSFYLHSRKVGKPWQQKSMYFIGPALLLLQHRTVWVLLIVSFIWMGLRDRRFRKWIPVGLAIMAGVGIVMTIILFGTGGYAGGYLAEAATSDTTFIWRLAGWIQLLTDFFKSGALALAIGEPFGSGWGRVIGGSYVDANPHDFYILILLRVGFCGFLALLIVFRNAIKNSKAYTAFPSWRLWTVIFIAQLTFCLTYPISYEQGVLLGLALSMRSVRPDRKTLQSRDPLPAAPSLPRFNEAV